MLYDQVYVLTFDQALDDSRHLNTTLDNGDLCDKKRQDSQHYLVYAKLSEKCLGKNRWFLFLVMHVEIWSSSIPGLMNQNVKYFEIVGNLIL